MKKTEGVIPMMAWALLVLGLVILVKGAEIFVRSARHLAEIMKLVHCLAV